MKHHFINVKEWLYQRGFTRSGMRWRLASLLHKALRRRRKNSYRYRFSITAIIKNEGPYLKEWIDYHLAAGFEHFYLFDNESTDNTASLLIPYIERDLVTRIPYAGRGVQLSAYNFACKSFGTETAFMAFIDADEFFVPSESFLHEKVCDLALRAMKKKGGERIAGLAVNWVHFGNSCQKTRSPGRVIDRFQHRSSSPSYPVKTIAMPVHIYSWENPHFPKFYKGFVKVDCGGSVVNGHEAVKPSLDWAIHLNHYATKSTEEWIQRKLKGTADCSSAPPISASDLSWETFERVNRNEVFDDSASVYYKNMLFQSKQR